MVEIRIRRSHLRAVLVAFVLAGAAFGVGAAVADHDPDVIHACAGKQSGNLRLVSSGSDCRSNETSVEWSSEGAIPTPQTCPAGQFVTGIDSGGNLTCAAPEGSGGDVCGDGVQGGAETCDDGGNSQVCDSDCSFAACGDGFVNQARGEQCDDGNSNNGDGCTITCTLG